MGPVFRDRVRSSAETPVDWTWVVGSIRVAVLLVVTAGMLLQRGPGETVGPHLVGFYLVGLAAGVWYLFALRGPRRMRSLATWAQVLFDFGVVAATIGFTGGYRSILAFLFVVVILEAGMLLGPAHGFVFATFATGYLGIHAMRPFLPNNADVVLVWYDLSIEVLAYYATAAISGYWNQRLTRLQAFQHEILDNMNNGFLITERSGVVAIMNKAAYRILEMEPATAVGNEVEDVIRAADGSESPALTALRSERDFTRYEFHAAMGDGSVKLLGLSTSRLYDAGRRFVGIIASFSDLTEMDKMRQELQRQDRLAVVGELAAGLAHEIRNPLAAIRGAVEELQGAADRPELTTKLSVIALRESDQLNRIVSDFLDFARSPSPRRERFDLRGLTEEVAELVGRRYADCEDLNVELDTPDHACAVSGDRGQIRQVFENICKNGVEAMDYRGPLRISVLNGGAFVEVRVDDDGPGIEPDVLERIFEPFYTTKASGVGMGLAVCHRIVTAHDGVLRAGVRQGGGTTLTVRLPLAPKEEETYCVQA